MALAPGLSALPSGSPTAQRTAISLGGLQVDGPFRRIRPVFRPLLFDLMSQVVVFGLGVARSVNLSRGVEGRDDVALFHFRPVSDQMSQGHRTTRSENLGNENFG